jgi:hypothetical protein
MRRITLASLALIAIAGTLVSCNSDKKAEPKTAAAETVTAAPADTGPLTVERSAHVKVTAMVKAIDQTTRSVTLQDASGHTTSFIAGPQVRRLNEVSVGDDVNAEYIVKLVAELRPPTAEEAANPIAAVGITGRASKSSDPAAGAAIGMRVVTTVQAVDIPNMLVTLRGPMGDSVVVKGRKKENLQRMHEGDTVVLTYTEALGIEVDKK